MLGSGRKYVFLYAAGPESLKEYFQKCALLGQKAALHLWYVDIRPNSVFANLAWYQLTKDLVSLFDPKSAPF